MFSSNDLKLLIEKRYDSTEWAVICEVADQTGGANRRADAMAFNLWPSRGLEIHGFEIKVSRSDWLSELKNPEKSQALQKFCNYWWIVTPQGIIKDDEMPVTWGHLEANDSGLRQKIKAPKLEPVPLNKPFMASLLRCVTTQTEKNPEWFENKLEKLIEERDKRSDEHRKQLEETFQKRDDERRQWLNEFQQKTGIVLSSYNAGQVAEFFRFWQNQQSMMAFKARCQDALAEIHRIKPILEGVINGQ